ncbi:hypothetical protein [Bremerella cremea]|uniref:hypothetical protein n=1 Tax=Bremerella cremea TaxID=1031537 RepID=UPI0031F0A2CB
MDFYEHWRPLLASGFLILFTVAAEIIEPGNAFLGGFYVFAILVAGLTRSQLCMLSVTTISILTTIAIGVASDPALSFWEERLVSLVWIAMAVPFSHVLCEAGEPGSSDPRQQQGSQAIEREARKLAHRFSNIFQITLGSAFMVQEELDANSPLRPDIQAIIDSARDGANLADQLRKLGRTKSAVMDTYCEEMPLPVTIAEPPH